MSEKASLPIPNFMKNVLDALSETTEKMERSSSRVSKSLDDILGSISFRIGKTIDACRESSNDMKAEAELKAEEIAAEMKKKEDLFLNPSRNRLKKSSSNIRRRAQSRVDP